MMLQRMAANMTIFVRKEFEDDFIASKPTHTQYMQRLQPWRDRFEKLIDSRPRLQEEKDSNQIFVRIQKYASKFETCRSNGSCWKRFTLYGNDHSRTSFIVQLPCHRQSRSEEPVIQILRTFNGALNRKKESRRRDLNFHLPAIISCSPSVRLFQTNSSYVSFGDIFDLHCEEAGLSKEEPILYSGEKVKRVLRGFREFPSRQLTKTEYITLKKEIFEEINVKMVPDSVITNYMVRTMDGPIELWRMRKQFTHQLAACGFMTFVLSISSGNPSRFQISRSTGLIAMTDLLPGISSQLPIFATGDVVPFRFTPNMQHFVGPSFMDGILAPSIMAIGQSLSGPEVCLSLFVYVVLATNFNADGFLNKLPNTPWWASAVSYSPPTLGFFCSMRQQVRSTLSQKVLFKTRWIRLLSYYDYHAHRLSTTKDAGVMGAGLVLESGTRKELLASGGAHANLVQAQKLRDHEELEDVRGDEDADTKEKEDYAVAARDEVPLDRWNTGRSLASEIVELKRTASDSKEERLFFACMNGLVHPAFGILYAKAIEAFSLSDDAGKRQSDLHLETCSRWNCLRPASDHQWMRSLESRGHERPGKREITRRISSIGSRSSIRTVASLTQENDCLELYKKGLGLPLVKSTESALWSNALYAASQSIAMFLIALVL
ncbi:hypothetical protein MD484_g8627, partial [Candolleomyces efflorescens]